MNLFTEPCRQDGIGGFLNGITQAGTNLMLKPLAAGLYCITLACTGHINQISPQCDHKFERYRKSRAFYQASKKTLPYDEVDGAAYSVFKMIRFQDEASHSEEEKKAP
jgi:hypothetical protein